MSKKSISFDIDNAISRMAKPSVFDRIVREIDANEIPPKYIQSVIVQYQDGKVVEIDGTMLNNPLPMNKDIPWDNMEEVFKKMKDIKVYINVQALEDDINIEVEKYLGKYC